MKLIRQVESKIFSKFYIKRFRTFKSAYEYCDQRNKGVYETDFICRYRFHKMNNFLKEGGNLLNDPTISTLLFSVNYYLKNFKNECPALIDYGGACGSTLLLLEKIFGEEILNKSFIVETPKFVEESKKWSFASKLSFTSSIDNILKNNNLSIFFSSGTIQYLEDPLQIISKVAESSIKIASFVRNNFSLKNDIYVQKSYLSENGLGKHISEYSDLPIYYPNRSIIKKELIDIFLKKSFRVIYDAEENKGAYGNTNYGGDLIFAKDN